MSLTVKAFVVYQVLSVFEARACSLLCGPLCSHVCPLGSACTPGGKNRAQAEPISLWYLQLELAKTQSSSSPQGDSLITKGGSGEV